MSSESKPIVSVTPENVGESQVQFNRESFDDFISGHGYRAWIERAIECPCKSAAMGVALPNCKNCNGFGWFFIDKQETLIGCTGMSNRTKYEVWSKENMGTVSMTVRPQDKLGYMDRVTLIELEAWFTQVIKPKFYNNTMFGFTIYPIVEAFEIFQFIAEDQPLHFLSETTDYVLEGNKVILNASFNNVQNLSISMRYLHHPVYHVIDINRDLVKQRVANDNGSYDLKNLPLNAIGRKAHYMFDPQNYDSDSVFDNTPNRVRVDYDKEFGGSTLLNTQGGSYLLNEDNRPLAE